MINSVKNEEVTDLTSLSSEEIKEQKAERKRRTEERKKLSLLEKALIEIQGK